MARKKKSESTEEAGAALDKGPTRNEMYGAALAALGNHAETEAVLGYIRDKYGLELKKENVSTGLSTYRKAAGITKGRKGKRRKKARAATEGDNGAALDGVSLKDIKALRALAGKLGPTKFRGLVELVFALSEGKE